MNIAAVLSLQARERGDSPALIETHHGRDRVLSFRALESAVTRVAGRIESEGIRAGDRVLILHPMSAALYVFLIALFRIGAVAIFLDPSAGRRHLDRCLRIAPPNAFFGSAKAQWLRLWIPRLRRVSIVFCPTRVPGTVRISLEEKGLESSAIAFADNGTPALITLTSGSTGEPRAALRTHGFLLAQHRALKASLGHHAGVMDLTTLPVFVLANLASGVTSVIPDADLRRAGRVDPGPVLRQCKRLPIATTAASPAFVSRLVEECDKTRTCLQGLKKVFMGGAPVFPEDMQQARETFPNAEIVAVYGSTEAEPMAEVSLSSIGAADFEAMSQGRGLLAGKPVDSVHLRVIQNGWGRAIGSMNEDQFGAMCLKHEVVGEIVVSGDHVLTSYLDGAGDSETKFQAGGRVWHRTGDLGWMDGQGRLWLMGRAGAAIQDERGVLYPFAVECAARQIPGIRRAAVLAVNGRRVLAVEGHPAAARDAIQSRLAWARIDEMRVLRSIPMDRRHNAKVDYVELRRVLSK